MEISFTVKRDMYKCITCKYNPKNMKFIQRIKNWFESFPVCGLCTAAEIQKKLKPNEEG